MIEIQATYGSISVNDLAAAQAFYVDKLGFKLLSDNMGLTLELPKGAQLFIYEKADHQPASFTVLNLVVADINAAVDGLNQQGISMEQYDMGEQMKQDEKGILHGLAVNMGPDIAWFTDPAGNIIAIQQPA